MTTKPGKKLKLIREDVKERHTSHWDLDYVSREELERLMSPEAGVSSSLREDTKEGDNGKKIDSEQHENTSD